MSGVSFTGEKAMQSMVGENMQNVCVCVWIGGHYTTNPSNALDYYCSGVDGYLFWLINQPP